MNGEMKLVSSNFTNGLCPFMFSNNVTHTGFFDNNFTMSCYINKPLN